MHARLGGCKREDGIHSSTRHAPSSAHPRIYGCTIPMGIGAHATMLLDMANEQGPLLLHWALL